MRQVQASIEIKRPCSVVWPLLAEFHHWPNWGPTVRAVRADKPAVEPGLQGVVQTPVGLWIPFEITTVSDHEYWDWKVAGVPATGHRVMSVGDSLTRVEFTVSGWLAPYWIVLNLGLRRLKALAETG